MVGAMTTCVWIEARFLCSDDSASYKIYRLHHRVAIVIFRTTQMLAKEEAIAKAAAAATFSQKKRDKTAAVKT